MSIEIDRREIDSLSGWDKADALRKKARKYGDLAAANRASGDYYTYISLSDELYDEARSLETRLSDVSLPFPEKDAAEAQPSRSPISSCRFDHGFELRATDTKGVGAKQSFIGEDGSVFIDHGDGTWAIKTPDGKWIDGGKSRDFFGREMLKPLPPPGLFAGFVLCWEIFRGVFRLFGRFILWIVRSLRRLFRCVITLFIRLERATRP